MKILFISNDPNIFNATSAVRERMRSYANAIGELHILSRAPHGAQEERDGALVLHPVHASGLFLILPMISRAHALIQKEHIDIVSAQDPFEYGWIALQAQRGTSAKLHVQLHTDFLSVWFTKKGGFRALEVNMPLLNRIRSYLADTVLPRAQGIRVVSKRIKDSLIARYRKAIVEPEIIPIGVPIMLPPSVAFPPHEFSFNLITVSRLEPEKRIEDILMALGRIAQRYPSVGLFIVGEGRERKRLETLTEKLGLTKRVIFLGWRNDASGLIRSAHAYIQASAYEGYGMTLIEAALARIPIITTDVGIVGEVLKGFEDVLSSPIADPVQLAVHTTSLVEDHQLRITLPMNAERSAKKHLQEYENRTERFKAHFERMLHTTS
jgi:glycosyltransferase involved in cell wall biosynthesis